MASRRRVNRRHSNYSKRDTFPYTVLLGVSLGAIIPIVYFAWQVFQRPDPDAATLCPATGPVGALAVLVDTSGPLSKPQQLRLRHEIKSAIDEAPTGTIVSLGRVSSDPAKRGAAIKLCKPIAVDEVNQFIANPKMAARRFEQDFFAPIHTFLESAIGVGEAGQTIRLRQYSEIEHSISYNGIAVLNTGTELVVRLPEKITFTSGSAAIRPSLVEPLRSIAQSMALHEESVVHVVGHTDSIGALEHNQVLSEVRARAVADVLIKQGIEPAQVKAVGRAFHEPIASNENEAGRSTNRRVDLVITAQAPIMESLQALVADTLLLVGDDYGKAIPRSRKVVLVSDMLQNSSVISFYEGGSWEEFQASRNFARLSQNLHGVSVEVLRLPRSNPAIRDPGSVEHFWAHYFDYQGASVKSRVIGDL